MTTIVANVQMFTKDQKVFVYEDGNTIEVRHGTIDTLPEILCALNDTYHAPIKLVGAKQYLSGYVKKINEAAITKYGNNPLNITIN